MAEEIAGSVIKGFIQMFFEFMFEVIGSFLQDCAKEGPLEFLLGLLLVIVFFTLCFFCPWIIPLLMLLYLCGLCSLCCADIRKERRRRTGGCAALCCADIRKERRRR